MPFSYQNTQQNILKSLPPIIFADAFINIAQNWHLVKPGTAEQWKTGYRSTKSGTVKPGYGIPNTGQTVSIASLTQINQD